MGGRRSKATGGCIYTDSTQLPRCPTRNSCTTNIWNPSFTYYHGGANASARDWSDYYTYGQSVWPDR